MTPLPERLSALALALALGGCALSEALPPSPYPEQVYGDWAVAPELCADGWWRFSEDRVDTARGLSCEVDDLFTSLEEVPVGTYELDCETEDYDSEPTWTVTLRLDGALDIDRRDGAGPIRLYRCGGAPAVAPYARTGVE